MKCEECDATIKDNKWAKIKAEGWFFSREDNKAYCPKHNPPWVAGWRARKNEESL